MSPITRSRLTLGAALLGLAAATACERKEAQEGPKLIAPGLAAASAPAAPQGPAEAQVGVPVLHVQTDTLVTTGTGGHEAMAVGDPGLQYEWFIRGGTLEGDLHSDAVTWTAGEPGEVRLYCQGTNGAGKKTVAMTVIRSEALPSIEQFAATPPVITLGHAAKLSWTSKEIKTLTLDPGGQDVSQASGPAIEVRPQETTTYTLTATNASGGKASQDLVVKVVPAPAISAFQGQGAISFGQAITLVGQFSGGKAEMRRGSDVIATSDGTSIQAKVPGLKEGDAFTLVVTNEAGDSVARSLNFSPAPAVAAPQK